MALNIANIDKLVTYLRTIDASQFNMGYTSLERHPCGTAACIAGHGRLLFGVSCSFGVRDKLGLTFDQYDELFTPDGWDKEKNGVNRYPLARAIDVVQHLRDTGEVDWDRFPPGLYRQPPAAPKPAWTPPAVIAIEPELPESLTSLLRQPAVAPS